MEIRRAGMSKAADGRVSHRIDLRRQHTDGAPRAVTPMRWHLRPGPGLVEARQTATLKTVPTGAGQGRCNGHLFRALRPMAMTR